MPSDNPILSAVVPFLAAGLPEPESSISPMKPDLEPVTLEPVPPPTVETIAPQPLAKVPPIARPSERVELFNRELSWLDFNRRVLSEAEDPTVPLLERLKFLAIASSNLDEFFMVRVGGIRDLITARITEKSPDGLTPVEQLKEIRRRSQALLTDMYRCLNDQILPELKKNAISIHPFESLSRKEQESLEELFDLQIAPILTPLALDSGHPFPFLANLTLNLAIVLGSEKGEEHVVFLKVPSLVPRLIALPNSSGYVTLEALIAEHAAEFFPGLRLLRVVPFRVIRNADILLREDEVQDLLQSVESELRRRDRKEVVWIEISAEADEKLISLLNNATHVSGEDVFFAPGLLKIADLMQIYNEVERPDLEDPPFNPRIPSQLASTEDMFSIIRKGDLLLHRPYDSFTAVVEFVQTAAEDPDVVAIKQTLYRSDQTSPIIEALANAATQGKQVTVVVELQARFDEMKNITWARRLEEAGVQVVYGLVGIKTHCKLCLVVRREQGQLRRYVHLSTGNYNAITGRIYTDIDLFMRDEAFGEDAAQLMNLLTGFSLASAQEIIENRVPELKWKRLIVAPMDYHRWTLEMIQREATNAEQGKPAHIIAKLNALVDPTVIQSLYRASQAGVKIELVVRGICCLVPGVAGLSENIKVVSVVDRFLEHARIFLFRNGGNSEVYVSSGDWMPRNFFRRIELTYPVLDAALKERIEKEILTISLADNVKGWKLQPDGTYKRREGSPRLRSQERFIETARSEAVRLGPYEETIRKPGPYRRKAKKLKKKEKSK